MVVLDTSVLVGHLRGDPWCRDLLRTALAGRDAVVPTLVEWELWKGADTPARHATVKSLLEHFEPALLTPMVARTAAELWRTGMDDGRPLATIDLLIAAHAIESSTTLATLDKRFDAVPSLQILGPSI